MKKCPKCGYEEVKGVKLRSNLEGFDIFWRVYPRKVGKGLAEKVWSKIRPNFELFSLICDAVERQRKSDQWTNGGGAYIPHPSTWLNQRRWEDQEGAKEVPKIDPQKVEQKKSELERLREKEYERIHGGRFEDGRS